MKRDKQLVQDARRPRQLDGRELAKLLQKIDSAKSVKEKRHWRKEFMRGFYGDSRADSYA